MPPSWVLLNRCVDYSFDDNDEPSWSVAAAAEVIKSRWGAKEASSIAPHYQPMVAMLMCSLKPADAVAVLPEPPEIATFMLRASKSHRGSLASRPLVACADKGLLVLYSGEYFGPGSFTCGCYLIHDAAADPSASPLSTVPPSPDARLLTDGIGSGAVVLRCRPVGRFPDPDPDAERFLWRSDEQPTPQLTKKEVHLPREVCWAPDKHMFYGDTSFAGPGGCLCWADLLHGLVICTNPHQDPDDPPVLRFTPLPDGCPAFGLSDYPCRPRMEESRSAACVRGRIKVVSMVGLLEGWNAQQFRLTTWTLSSPDDVLSGGEWQEDGVFPLEDLWATEEYRALNLPPQTPLCPVLSAARDEDGVVYAVVNDIEERVIVQGRIQQIFQGTELKFKRQYVLGIDVRRNKIVSTSSGVPPENLMQMTPHLLPFDLCASAHGGAKDRQRDVEASQIGDNGKRLKV